MQKRIDAITELPILGKMMNTDEFAGLWRASAMEKVPYTDDFPEQLLVLPELYDGAIGQGNATEITTAFLEGDSGEWTLVVKDNGRGIRNIPRLLKWSAPTSIDNYHRNGHGLKKALTKFAPDYASATWTIRWRNPGQSLNTVHGPFRGLETPIDTDEDNRDTTTLMPSGTQISVKTKLELFGSYQAPDELLAGIKEIIQTRFAEDVLRRVRFRLTTKTRSGAVKTIDSEEWHSFKWWVQRGVEDGTIERICEDEPHTSAGAPWLLSRYKILVNGATSYDLKREFPTYGAKNQQTQRVSIALEKRTIEYAPYHKFVGRDVAHNKDNGTIVCVEFVSPELAKKPEPSTTKVSMYELNPIYKEFKADVQQILMASPVNPPMPPHTQTVFDIPILPPQIQQDVPRAAAPTRIAKLEEALGVKFRFSGDEILVQIQNSTEAWIPITGFGLRLSTQSTA
jgi:hypothetical protein